MAAITPIRLVVSQGLFTLSFLLAPAPPGGGRVSEFRGQDITVGLWSNFEDE